MNSTKVKQILSHRGLISSANVIRKAFATVARDLCLNKTNCPTHASFITLDKLKELKQKGAQFFGLFTSRQQVGFVALEKVNNNLYYLEKLAILPALRHRGYGSMLVDHIVKQAKHLKAKSISIAIIDRHTILKNWYKKLGFRQTGKKDFAQLPFTVCFMEKKINLM